MSSNTKAFEDKMKSAVEHLERELKTVRAGRANPGVLDKVTVDYYGSPTPIQQVASVAVSEARTLTITPWDRTLLRAISKAILASDVGINPIDDGQTFFFNDTATTEIYTLSLHDALPISNPGVLDKVTVDYYGSPTPIQQVASVAVSEARTDRKSTRLNSSH